MAALYMYLMRMRTGLPYEDIGNVFHVTTTTAQKLIRQIRSVLMKDFVPQNVNYIRTREDLIGHNTVMSNSLFDPENKKKIMLVCDGTYIFIDKSENYIHQKKTFSGQKKRNFIKVMNINACDGTVVHCISPFPAVQNDASILKHLYENTVIFDVLKNDDILLLDRGFRDVVSLIESKGITVKMPALVQSSEKKGQLNTKEANRSRLVTALRFVVKTRNGHLKTIWKMFNKTWSSYSQVHLSEDVEICYALINKFYQTFESNKNNARQVAQRMLSKLEDENIVGNIVSKSRFQKCIKKFTPFDNLDQLPELTKEHLFFVSLGGYQIKQAKSYTQMHIKQNENRFVVYTCPDEICFASFPSFYVGNRDPILFMMRLNSRFRSNVTHSPYVLIDKNSNDENAVLGHYCECYNGWRTLGCCSHIMTLISFLLHTKGKSLEDPAGFLDGIFNDG